ncbi:ras guanine nucleotide exchange factor domain-containing protein [Mycotypha africana]|uniref:ras guanine nucleotide exchange factor domain-containing protein n=1 Tax=Mycotypha africana TaxID=64632 RepID=UPI002301972F|nr:ras guanine nucleotide exchange factor domain-containing protein [Mycotypha africana]KAI8991465.1 ras guanine nucleotide exchange factor domain-containing protein [Mycotypha africana]
MYQIFKIEKQLLKPSQVNECLIRGFTGSKNSQNNLMVDPSNRINQYCSQRTKIDEERHFLIKNDDSVKPTESRSITFKTKKSEEKLRFKKYNGLKAGEFSILERKQKQYTKRATGIQQGKNRRNNFMQFNDEDNAINLEHLFMRLTDAENENEEYIDTFLIAHSFFTTSTRLLQYLIARFYCSNTMTGPQKTQSRILNVILRWIKIQFEVFALNPRLLTDLQAFLDESLNKKYYTFEVEMIREAIQIQLVQNEKPCLYSQHYIPCLNTTSSLTMASTTGFTPPMSPKSSHDGSTTPLLFQQPEEIAMYLTLVDFANLKCITTYDYLDMYSRSLCDRETMQATHYVESTYNLFVNSTDNSEKRVDYIKLMAERTNSLTKWVTDTITVHQLGSKQRAAIVQKMIEVAKLCLDWNNFHTSMTITLGLMKLPDVQPETVLSSAKHDRQYLSLVPTNPSLSHQAKSYYKHLVKYTDVSSNMRYYRSALAKVRSNKNSNQISQPCIPFFPILLKDLHFLMDGNETKRSNDGLINFSKFRLLKKMLDTISSYTASCYWFASNIDQYPFSNDMFRKDVFHTLLNKISLSTATPFVKEKNNNNNIDNTSCQIKVVGRVAYSSNMASLSMSPYN